MPLLIDAYLQWKHSVSCGHENVPATASASASFSTSSPTISLPININSTVTTSQNQDTINLHAPCAPNSHNTTCNSESALSDNETHILMATVLHIGAPVTDPGYHFRITVVHTHGRHHNIVPSVFLTICPQVICLNSSFPSCTISRDNMVLICCGLLGCMLI